MKSGTWASPRERDEARSAILDVAKQLFEAKGAEAVTLSAVAKAAAITRPAIYSHFSSRQDLLLAIGAPVPEKASKPAPAAPASEEVLASTEAPESDETPATSEAETPVEAAVAGDELGSDYDQLMRAQAEALQEISKQVIVPKPRLRDATETALSKMEARLVVAEQSFSALEQRVGEKLKTFDSETDALSAAFMGLRERVEKFEERQDAALAQLRLDVHNMKSAAPQPSTVLQVAQAQPLAPVAVEPSPVEPASVETGRVEPTVETPIHVSEDAAAESAPEAEAAPEAEPVRKPDYLNTARIAAIQAAQAPQKRPTARHRSPLMRALIRRRWVLICVAAVLVVWFDVYVFANYQPAQGSVPTASQAVVRPARMVMSPQDQLVRGLKYLNGAGVPVNTEKAARLLKRAATRGEPVAQNFVGVLYQTGTGVSASIATAVHWYEAAAQQGNLKAMTNLGKLYAGGWKDGTDFVKAANWFSRAAALGDVDAQFDLAILYERGQGVSHNLTEAYKWYAIAGANGDVHAAERATILEAQLDPDELWAAKTAIAHFAPQPVRRVANDVPKI